MYFEDIGSSTSAEEFKWATAVMNAVAIAQFFKTTYIGIFKRLLVTKSTGERLLGPVSTYYRMVEINIQEILYLHYLV